MPTSENTAKKSKPMPKKMLQHFEKRLMEERRRAVKELGNYGEAFGATELEGNMPARQRVDLDGIRVDLALTKDE